jgi:hypothetical protein
VASEEEGPLHILLLAEVETETESESESESEPEENLANGRYLCENLIATVKVPKQQAMQQKAAKCIKKKKKRKEKDRKGSACPSRSAHRCNEILLPGRGFRTANPGERR